MENSGGASFWSFLTRTVSGGDARRTTACAAASDMQHLDQLVEQKRRELRAIESGLAERFPQRTELIETRVRRLEEDLRRLEEQYITAFLDEWRAQSADDFQQLLRQLGSIKRSNAERLQQFLATVATEDDRQRQQDLSTDTLHREVYGTPTVPSKQPEPVSDEREEQAGDDAKKQRTTARLLPA